jgi:hypothetical protein
VTIQLSDCRNDQTKIGHAPLTLRWRSVDAPLTLRWRSVDALFRDIPTVTRCAIILHDSHHVIGDSQ